MKNTLLLLFALCLAFGCNDYLNEEPDNRAKVETPGDIQELLVNAYPQAAYHLICEMMSDNVRDRGFSDNCVTEITDDEMYNWKEGTSSDYDSPFALWTGLYEGIASANYAIRVIESKDDRESYRAALGEALLCRAFSHFILLQLWAEAYDPATAATAMGIPYVTEPETEAVKQYARNTMAETVALMETDIRRGIGLIDDRIYSQPKFHFTKRAAHAFATKFYAYLGTDWQRVLDHSLQAVPEDFTTELRDHVAAYAEAGGGDDRRTQAKNYTDPGNRAILLSVCVPTYYNDIYARCPISNSRYVLTPTLSSEVFYNGKGVTLAGPWVYRGSMIYGQAQETFISTMKNYAYFKAVSATSNSGMTYVNEPMLTVEDVVFHRMEAHIMMGDTTRFLRDMNRYLPTRISGNNNTVSMRGRNNSLVELFSGTGWDDKWLAPWYKDELETNELKMAGMMAVVAARRVEFVQEGQRWFDIKRFHLPVVHYSHWDRVQMRLERDDPRRVLQIPQEAQKVGVAPWPRD